MSGMGETGETDDGSRSEVRSFRNFEPRTSHFELRIALFSLAPRRFLVAEARG
jgi:hypothetical protein